MNFERCPENPILAPDPAHHWEDEAVFNPGAVFHNGKFHLLYRTIGEYDHYISHVGHAVSANGIHFERKPEPVLKPQKKYERFGIEDIRINSLEGKFYLTHTVLGRPAPEGGEPHQVGLMKTENFETFERLGVITPPGFCSRDAVIFPEKISGFYLMLHRPLYLTRKQNPQDLSLPEASGIWIAYSKNLLEWEDHQLVMEPIYWWEEQKIGSGPPPIKTEKGWLMVYHGVDKNSVYRAGIALLALEDPRKVIARTKEPILEPTMNYEKIGDTPNVVFPTGLILKNGLLYLYYGAADKTCCLATVALTDLFKIFS